MDAQNEKRRWLKVWVEEEACDEDGLSSSMLREIAASGPSVPSGWDRWRLRRAGARNTSCTR